MGFRALFEPISGAAAFGAAQRPSHPLRQTVRPSNGLRSETVEGLFISGACVHLLRLPKDALPQDVVSEFWSVIVVSLPDFRPVPNYLDRFALSTWSNVQK